MVKKREERFSKVVELEGVTKRNSSRLAKISTYSLNAEARQVLNNKYLKHLEADNLSSKGKGLVDALVYANTETLRLPKRSQKKKGRLNDLKRLPLHISLHTAIQEAKYQVEKETKGDTETPEKPAGGKKESKPAKSKANYLNISAKPSITPTPKLCAMCGFEGPYTCIQCKSFYCSISCKETHDDTRCNKWKM